MMQQQDTLLTAKQVAQILAVSPQRVYELISKGRLESLDLNQGTGGNRWVRISKASLDAYMDRCRVKAAEPVKPRYKN